MAIVIREVSDDDLPRAVEVESAAYADNPLRPILFPGPFPPEFKDEKVRGLIRIRQEDASVRYIQAYDEETAQLIAFAKWHVYDTPENAAAARKPILSFGPGTNKQACEDFYGRLVSKKTELMGGKPHVYLSMLHVDPKFQGRGAGGMLVEWGTKKADELDLPVYLESSHKGHRVYQRYGFRDLEVVEVDLVQYGSIGLYKEPLMIREPVRAQQ